MKPAIPPSDSLDSQILATLSTVFGYDSFRPLQEEIVHSILSGRDAFVLMPTGGGKSLCYQLPALLLDGLTIVVSPLIALMKDQVDAMQALGIAATFINSSLDAREINRRQAQVVRGEVRLLYVAPERLMLPGFLSMLSGLRVDCIAIDEAHCISEWGHDFRPEYRELRRLRASFPSATLAAFTATATPRVQADIVAQLGLQKADSFRGSFNRPNLFYEVRPKQNSYSQLVAYLRQHRGQSGIIYCQSRKSTEDLAARLTADGYLAAAYHAGLTNDERRERQEAFIKDDVPIIVATIAFGMGIDKPDVRFVVHYDLPKNLEGYYQESGRAGRDGEPSDCILFYSYGDVLKYQRFIAEMSSDREQEIAKRQLKQMADWANNQVCRRVALLGYFDEQFAGQEAPCCDICRGPAADAVRVDRADHARALLECARRTGERFGLAYLIGVLRGATDDERIQRYGHDKLAVWGAGVGLSAQEWRHLAGELRREGHIRQAEEEYNAIKLTPLGQKLLQNNEPLLVIAPPAPAPRASRRKAAAALDPTQPVDSPLFEKLRGLRKRIADERRLPPYVIFNDATLRAMASMLPRNKAELLTLPGVGEHKAEEYGEAFLAVIAAQTGRSAAYLAPFASTLSNQGTQGSFADERQQPRSATAPVAATRPVVRSQPIPRNGTGNVERLIERPRPPASSTAGAGRNGLTPTVMTTVALFNEGHSPLAIAAKRQLGIQAVEEHLTAAIEAGEPLDLRRLVSEPKQRAIQATMSQLGTTPLKPVMEQLGDGFSYGELKWVRAVLNRERA